MDFEEIVKSRYATKKFDGKKIPEEKFQKLCELIRLSASSFNLQPWKIKIVTDQKIKDKLQAASWNQPQVGTASHVLVFCADISVDKLVDKLEKEMLKHTTADKIKDYMAMMRGFGEGLDEERKVSWAQKQVYIALGNALNGAKALGFDSCPMEGFDPKQYSEILKLPADLVPTVVCPIGYAADAPKPKLRFKKEDLFF